MAYVKQIEASGGSIYDIFDAGASRKINGIYYGTCSTAQSTKAKEVTLQDSTGFSLTTGAIVFVKFTNASAASQMTLAVAGTTAKPIKTYGTTDASSSTTTNGWRAGACVPFVYDGTNWIRAFWENTTYSSKAAAEGGTDVSLVTTGEKYQWNQGSGNFLPLTGGTLTGTLNVGDGISDDITLYCTQNDGGLGKAIDDLGWWSDVQA